MNPSQILFDQISTMTNGLITDGTTLCLGLLGVGFILFAFDILKDTVEGRVNAYASDKWAEKAGTLLAFRNGAAKGSFQWHKYNSRYQSALRRSTSLWERSK